MGAGPLGYQLRSAHSPRADSVGNHGETGLAARSIGPGRLVNERAGETSRFIRRPGVRAGCRSHARSRDDDAIPAQAELPRFCSHQQLALERQHLPSDSD
jgi:hypothetical protein